MRDIYKDPDFHCQVLFTVSNLVIAGAFSVQQQALAGGVFNSIAQMGNSVGLGVCATIAASTTGEDSMGPDQLLRGYRAAFWTMFASTIIVCAISLLGLGKGGKVGRKED